MSKVEKNPPNRQIYEEASEWLVELRVGELDASGRERLDAWFRESPHHIRAFLELSSVWDNGGDPALDVGNSAAALIATARASTNVVALDAVPSPPVAARTHLWRFVLVAVVAIVCIAGSLLMLHSHVNQTYVTDTGEQRIVRLRDGSILTLDSRSRVRVRFSDRERNVDLLEGQALFQVEKDPARPFVVGSDSARVRAVGTQFDVYRKMSGTTVTVVEGRVAVSGSATPNATTLASTGDQVIVTPARVTLRDNADVAAATAWTRRELTFDSVPLTEVAREFNRYNVRQLIVGDARLAEFHVTGVFSSTDPAALLRFLRTQPGIQVQEGDTEIRISAQ